jgi:hypothetical protein
MLLAAFSLALAAQPQRPIRAGCIDVRPLFVPVELQGRIVERPSRSGGATAYDLVLDRTICIDGGAVSSSDQRLARIGIYATDRAIQPRLRAHVGQSVRIRGQAFTTYSLVQPGRVTIVVNVEVIAAAGR